MLASWLRCDKRIYDAQELKQSLHSRAFKLISQAQCAQWVLSASLCWNIAVILCGILLSLFGHNLLKAPSRLEVFKSADESLSLLFAAFQEERLLSLLHCLPLLCLRRRNKGVMKLYQISQPLLMPMAGPGANLSPRFALKQFASLKIAASELLVAVKSL